MLQSSNMYLYIYNKSRDRSGAEEKEEGRRRRSRAGRSVLLAEGSCCWGFDPRQLHGDTHECLAFVTVADRLGGRWLGLGKETSKRKGDDVCSHISMWDDNWEGDEACEKCQDLKVDLCSGFWKACNFYSIPLPHLFNRQCHISSSTHQSPFFLLFPSIILYIYNILLIYKIYLHHVSYLCIYILQSLLIILSGIFLCDWWIYDLILDMMKK